MGKLFFIADTHFGSEEVRRYENRPFVSAAVMDAAMIERWNQAVSDDDTVWHLGDFGADGKERETLSQLKGRKLFVKGNHDTASNAYYREAGFDEVYDLPVLLKEFWILSHEPLYVSENMPYANLFGHVHNNPAYKDFSPHHFCVSAERIGYRPISFEEILASVQEKN